MIKIHIGGENSSLQKAGVQNGQIAETAGEEESTNQEDEGKSNCETTRMRRRLKRSRPPVSRGFRIAGAQPAQREWRGGRSEAKGG